MERTGATFADAAAEWLRYVEHDRRRKPSTVSGYQAIVRAHLLPAFGSMPIESITPAVIEAWLAGVDRASSTRLKALVLMHGIFQRARKVWSLPANPVADVEKPPLRASGDIQVFSPEEVWALVRAADSQQDAALFLTAAFTGLRRGELLALRWRGVDFAGSAVRVGASYYAGHLTTPKSGKVRAVPLAPDVAAALAQPGHRVDWIGDDDLVFVGVGGGHLDGSALRRRYKDALRRAELRAFRPATGGCRWAGRLGTSWRPAEQAFEPAGSQLTVAVGLRAAGRRNAAPWAGSPASGDDVMVGAALPSAVGERSWSPLTRGGSTR
jgi:integrase